jgi:hypothetical protein
MFSHTFLLFLSLLSYSSIFAKLLLTNFFAPFLAALESNFLSHFLVPLALQGSTLCMCPNISGTERMGFLKEDTRRNLVADSLPVMFPLSAFCRRFLMQTSAGQTQIIPFLLTIILELNFLAWYKPRWVTQYSSGKESSWDFQTCE